MLIQTDQFYIQCDDDLEQHARWLRGMIETHLQIHEDANIQLGWSVFRLKRIDGVLFVCEPNFSANPLLDFRPDVSVSLRVLAQQVNFMRRCSCASTGVRFDDKVIVQANTFSHSGFYGQRSAPRQVYDHDGHRRSDDTGWFFGLLDNEAPPHASELETLYVFELLERQPILMQLLCLPAEYLVVIENGRIEAVVNSDNENILQETR